MGLHICQISQRGTDQRGEWVSVANDGPTSFPVTGLEITDFTRTPLGGVDALRPATQLSKAAFST